MDRKLLLLGVLVGCGQSPAPISWEGRVVDPQGRPIPQAAVWTGGSTILTGDDGGFSLPAPGRVTIAASGSLPITRELAPGDTLILSPRPLRKLVLDASHQPLGGRGSEWSGLTAEWLKEGFRVDLPQRFPDLAEVETLVIAAPKTPYSDIQQAAIQEFVQNGGKLMLLGEWGGFAGFNPRALNQLAAPYGITFASDLIRDQGRSAIKAGRFTPHPVTGGIQQLQLFGATSLSLRPPAQAVGFAQGLRVADLGDIPVLAIALYGAGRVIALGDCSLWIPKSDGTMPIQEADNRQLAHTLVTW